MQSRTLAVSKLACLGKYGFTEVPLIRLSGYWVEKLGFKIGGRAEVKVNDDNSITLLPQPEESESSGG